MKTKAHTCGCGHGTCHTGNNRENQSPSMVFFRGFNQRYRMSKLGHSLFPSFMGTVVLVLRGMVIRSDPHHERGVGNHSPQGLLQ